MNYFTDGGMTDIKHFPDCLHRIESLSIKLSDLNNLGFRQLNMRMLFASMARTMFMFVEMVVGSRIPSQIIKSAMVADTIIMASFHARRTGTDKRNEDKMVNFAIIVLFVFTKYDEWITPIYSRAKGSLRNDRHLRFIGTYSPIRSHSPLVTHIVPGEAWDRQPSLLNLIWNRAKVLVSHGAGLLGRLASGLEPVLLRKQLPACFFIT